jgi:hypothetical protein
MEQGINDMLYALDCVSQQSCDPPDGPLMDVSTRVSGARGRPRVEIEPEFLSMAMDLRGPTGIAHILNCSARTVRRRALEYRLVKPGAPVYVDYEDPESGTTYQFFTSLTGPVSELTDGDLDVIMQHILTVFPHFGRWMIVGHLHHLGHCVPQE